MTAGSGGRANTSSGWVISHWSSWSSPATSTTTDSSPSRPARPACCHIDAIVPGKPSSTHASRPPMSMPSSSAVVATTPRRRAAEQLVLDLASLRGQVAASVGPHSIGQLDGQAAAHVGGHELGALAAAAEGDRAVAAPHQLGHDPGGLAAGRRASSRAGVGRSSPAAGFQSAKSRSPCGEPSSVTSVTSRPHRSEARRPAWPMRGRREDEGRRRPVVRAQPAQAAQEVGDVGAEHAAQHVQLVDHDVAAAASGRSPTGRGGAGCRGGASRGWSARTLALARTQCGRLSRCRRRRWRR